MNGIAIDGSSTTAIGRLLGRHGLIFSGLSPNNRLVEIAEMADHPFMLGSQFHPEFKSRPNRPHPLFDAFMAAAVQYQAQHPDRTLTTPPREREAEAMGTVARNAETNGQLADITRPVVNEKQ